MTYRLLSFPLLSLILTSALIACGARPVASAPPRPPAFVGVASYDDGKPAKGALIAIADVDTGKLIDVATVDDHGRYESAVPTGKYAVAAATENGFAWVESQEFSSSNSPIILSRSCHPLVGHVAGITTATRINLERQSLSQGDTFIGPIRADGDFALCLPEGQYRAFLTGGALSVSTKVDLPATASLRIRGVAISEIKRAPPRLDRVHAGLAELVADVAASDAKVIGLGEATHGTAEFFSARGALTFELIRRANVRLLLFEFDAIASVALDDYVNGADIDAEKAVAALGFWTTDTYEFLRFLEDLRQYNATTSDKVHIWGIDQQNTTRPVEVLVADAEALSITADEQATLKLLVKRGKAVKDLSVTQRSNVDVLLSRLGKPRGTSQHDLLIAVAARSLATQLGYWVGDMGTWHRKRRDAGMASLASFIVTQVGAKRACLWAHDGHISKQPGEWMLGNHLSLSELHYYAIGFYLWQGSARAVDAAGKIGVISYPIPVASKYMMESVVMEASGMPQIAWLPLRGLPSLLAKWLEIPRYSRELGAVYLGEDDMMILRSIRTAFDAVVVVKTGHDSSPTPTGVRVFKH